MRSCTLHHRHYQWALTQVFDVFGLESVIIVEDDLDISSVIICCSIRIGFLAAYAGLFRVFHRKQEGDGHRSEHLVHFRFALLR